MEEKLSHAEEQGAEKSSPFLTRRDLSNSSAIGRFEPSKSTDSLKFSSKERLKSKKVIDNLFKEGKSVNNSGFTLVYLVQTHETFYPIKAGFSVPKRYFKKAVDRNRIKRQMREVYRLEKKMIYEKLAQKNLQVALMCIYKGKTLPSFETVKTALQFCLQKISAL